MSNYLGSVLSHFAKKLYYLIILDIPIKMLYRLHPKFNFKSYNIEQEPLQKIFKEDRKISKTE
ncbi:hypothetical protein [Algoriphagus sp.]|uniref:hypothetical protein n=1 Tax=Algoriphagus sp. TaxID=1872435 RepID=UPI003F70626E